MDGHLTGPDRTEPVPTTPPSRRDAVRDGRGLSGHAGACRTLPRADDLSAHDILGFLNEQIRAVEHQLATALRRS